MHFFQGVNDLLNAAASTGDAVQNVVSGSNVGVVSDSVVTNSDVGNSCLSMCTEGGTLTILIVYAIIGVVFYFLIYRPQKKRRQQEEILRSNVEIGDEIITVGGICGRIISVKDDDTIVIESGADRTKLKMKSWCISSNETAKERIAAQQPAKEEKKKPSLFSKKDS